MITIIVLFVLALIALLLFAVTANAVRRHDDDTTATAGIIFAVALLALVIFTVCQSVKVIGANEVGVPVTFGRLGTPLSSGFHMVAPWTEVETLPTRPRTFTTVAKVRTSESGTVAVRLSARWAVQPDDAAALYQQVRTGDEERIQEELIGPNLASAAGAFYGGLTNFTAVSGSNWAANATGTETQARTNLARYGIALDTVQVREVNPDKATEDAIARVSAQQRATNIALEAQKTATAEAKRRSIEATGLAAAAKASSAVTPAELASLCLQAAERIMNRNNDRGIPTYTLPCQDKGTPVTAAAK